MIEFDEFIHILDHPMITLSKSDIKQSMETCFRYNNEYYFLKKILIRNCFYSSKLVPTPISDMNESVASTMSVDKLRKVFAKHGNFYDGNLF